MTGQPWVTRWLSVIWTPSPAFETTPTVSALVPIGGLTLIVVGDPAPIGDTGSSHPEPPPARTEALCSLLGTETVCFRVAPEVTAVEVASPSAVTPCRVPRLEGDWSQVCWPLFCTIASTICSALLQCDAAKRDFGYLWVIFTVNTPDEPPKSIFLWCFALPCGLQLNYVALRWTRGARHPGKYACGRVAT